MSFHNNSLEKAITDLFPDIHSDTEPFEGISRCGSRKLTINIQGDNWDSPEKRRKFLEDFAKVNNFDPLSPTSWYLVKPSDFSMLMVLSLSQYQFRLI